MRKGRAKDEQVTGEERVKEEGSRSQFTCLCHSLSLGTLVLPPGSLQKLF